MSSQKLKTMLKIAKRLLPDLKNKLNTDLFYQSYNKIASHRCAILCLDIIDCGYKLKIYTREKLYSYFWLPHTDLNSFDNYSVWAGENLALHVNALLK